MVPVPTDLPRIKSSRCPAILMGRVETAMYRRGVKGRDYGGVCQNGDDIKGY